MSSLTTIKNNLHYKINSINSCIEFYSNKGEVVSAIKSSLTSNEGFEYYKKIIDDKFVKLKIDSDIYFNSFFVLLCASYESFLTETLKELLNILNNCSNKSIIPDKLKKLNLRYSGSLLTTLDNSPSHLRIDYKEIIENLAFGVNKTENYKFNKDIVFYVKGILNFDNFIDFVDKFELDLKIEDFADTAEFKSFFSSGSRTSERSSEISTQHQFIFRTRNNIAHNGFSTDVTKEKLVESLNFIEKFSEGVSNLLLQKIQSKYFS